MTFVSVLSDVLGYVVIAGSALFQLPQIYTILSTHSAEGVSLLAYVVETYMFAASLAWGVAYDLPFATYGETIPVYAQLITVMLLLGYYNKQMPAAAGSATLLTIATYLMAYRLVPDFILYFAYTSQVLNTILAKLPQVYLNYKRKGVGRLNLFTVMLMFAGAATRVFTTYVDVAWEQGKAIMLAGFGCGMILNGLMVAQFYIYRNSSTDHASVSAVDTARSAQEEGSSGGEGEDGHAEGTRADASASAIVIDQGGEEKRGGHLQYRHHQHLHHHNSKNSARLSQKLAALGCGEDDDMKRIATEARCSRESPRHEVEEEGGHGDINLAHLHSSTDSSSTSTSMILTNKL